MNNLQYYHGNKQTHHITKQSYTAVCDVPYLNQIKNLIVDYMNGFQEPVSIPVGITFVNPKDNYCKSIGREESLKNCRSLPFVLNSLDFHENRTTLYLSCQNELSYISDIVLEICKNRKKVHLIKVMHNKE